MPFTVTRIIGFASQPDITDRPSVLAHAGRVEHLRLDRGDSLRRWPWATTDRGADRAVTPPRDQQLRDGAVLALDDERAIVVRMAEERRPELEPRHTAAALELGYFAGTLPNGCGAWARVGAADGAALNATMHALWVAARTGLTGRAPGRRRK